MNRRKTVSGILCALGMCLLILDAKTALDGASNGIRLCVQSLIPSLFPFFVLSAMLVSSLSGGWLLRRLSRLCGMPAGSEGILLVGLLGGYPMGAQCVAQQIRSGVVTKEDGQRMLGFCNNAGPAFLFGVVAGLFSRKATVFALWIIQILAALAAGILLPGKSTASSSPVPPSPLSLSEALRKSVASMAVVCGWVILFRVILAFLDRWILWLFPEALRVSIIGLLELTNGCYALRAIPSEALRFLLANLFVCFGGLCVSMQTAAVTSSENLSLKQYFLGKAVSCMVSLLLSCAWIFLWQGIQPVRILLPLAALFALILCFSLKKSKNGSGNPGSHGV